MTGLRAGARAAAAADRERARVERDRQLALLVGLGLGLIPVGTAATPALNTAVAAAIAPAAAGRESQPVASKRPTKGGDETGADRLSDGSGCAGVGAEVFAREATRRVSAGAWAIGFFHCDAASGGSGLLSIGERVIRGGKLVNGAGSGG